MAESCPFLRPFLGFEYIFKSDNTSWGVGKFWATVFLGPYLSSRLKTCKRFQFASRNPLRLLSMPSSPQDARFGQRGSREMGRCRSHHWEWSLNKRQGQCQKRGKRKASHLACLLKSRDIYFFTDQSGFYKIKEKGLSAFPNLDTYIRMLWILRIKGVKLSENYCSLGERELLYIQELGNGDLRKVNV